MLNFCHTRERDMALFWFSSWIEGRAPKNNAPLQFEKASRKKILLEKTTIESGEYCQFQHQQKQESVLLWEDIRRTQSDLEAEDQISWRWTSDGVYMTHSASLIQFMGGFK